MTRATRHAQAPLEDAAALFDSPQAAEAAAARAARAGDARPIFPTTATLVAPEPVAGGKWIARDLRNGATLDRNGRWR